MIDKNIFSILACPICKGNLVYKRQIPELICKPCGVAFPVKDGIPIMLPDEARTISVEERIDSNKHN